LQPERHADSIAGIAQALRPALRVGLRVGRLHSCRRLLDLDVVQQRARDPSNPESLAYALEAVLRDALHALGDGPYGRAARLLFGAVPDTRGRPLYDRRRLAAEQLDMLPTTFRQNWEPEFLIDIAAEIARPSHQAHSERGPPPPPRPAA